MSLRTPTIGPGLCVSEGDPNSAVVAIAGLLKETDAQEGGSKKKRNTWVDYSSKRV